MEQKKKSKIILIAIIVVIILLVVIGITYSYFATDIFKSKKELFFKYTMQMAEQEEGFIEESVKEFFKKQKSMPYANEGSISFNVEKESNQEEIERVNNMTITFKGEVDSTNNARKQNISLNYSNDVKIPIEFKQIENEIGIQNDDIGIKYIGTKLQEIEPIEKMQEIGNIQISKEEIQRIKDTYINIVNKELQEKNFSKIEEANGKGYKLTLKGEELKRIIVKLLENLKNDQGTLEKINEYLKVQKNSSKIVASDIENAIKDINEDAQINDKNIEITIYQNKRKTKSISIKIDEIEIKIEKNITGNDTMYNIEIQINDSKINLNAKYAGLQSMQSVAENYELTIEIDEEKYQYNYNNNIEFIENANIEKFNSDNSLMLDELEEEQKNQLIMAIMERIQSINSEKMQELGVSEEENPIIDIITPIVENIGGDNGQLVNVSEVEVETFNTKFENYAGTNIKGVTVKGLLTTIGLSNESEENKIKEIHFDGQEYETTDQNIAFIKDSVETESIYRVEFEKDEDTGIIYRAVINKK